MDVYEENAINFFEIGSLYEKQNMGSQAIYVLDGYDYQYSRTIHYKEIFLVIGKDSDRMFKRSILKILHNGQIGVLFGFENLALVEQYRKIS